MQLVRPDPSTSATPKAPIPPGSESATRPFGAGCTRTPSVRGSIAVGSSRGTDPYLSHVDELPSTTKPANPTPPARSSSGPAPVPLQKVHERLPQDHRSGPRAPPARCRAGAARLLSLSALFHGASMPGRARSATGLGSSPVAGSNISTGVVERRQPQTACRCGPRWRTQRLRERRAPIHAATLSAAHTGMHESGGRSMTRGHLKHRRELCRTETDPWDQPKRLSTPAHGVRSVLFFGARGSRVASDLAGLQLPCLCAQLRGFMFRRRPGRPGCRGSRLHR